MSPKRFSRTLAATASTAAVAAGFAIRPRALGRPPGVERPARTADLPVGLPEPVSRFFRDAYGAEMPVVDTVSLWGRVRMRIGPVRLHGTMRNHHVLGRDFAGRFAATWYRVPLVRGSDGYVGGRGFARILRSVHTGPDIDQAAALFMWSEAFLFPSAVPLQPTAAWEPLGMDTARLVIPVGASEAVAHVSFDPVDGRPVAFRAHRFKAPGTKVGWEVRYHGWRRHAGLLVPERATVAWDDEPGPWLTAEIEGTAVGLDEPFGPLEP